MTTRNLDALFAPASVAVIGASRREGSIGNIVMRNLREAGFEGPVLPVNPHHASVAGVLAYPDVASLPVVPDLAVICTPAGTVVEVVEQLAARGTRAVALLSAGVTAEDKARLMEIAQPHVMRLLGPNCVGLMVPRVGLNATFAHASATAGKLGFASSSGALCTAVLDWAKASGIGMSSFVSLGDALDVDFGDTVDELGNDPDTRAILLYIESVADARKFLTAARAASRNKPVVAIKSGRGDEGVKAARSHTGALAGSDDVWDYALRRAGVLRVDTIGELFDAVETLARAGELAGDRLAIVTNGGGPGVMAADTLGHGGGRLAELSAETMAALDAFLPDAWSRADPVDVLGDATPERLARSVEVVAADPGVDAVLVLYAPSAIAHPAEVARAVAEVAGRTDVPVLTCWLGRDRAAVARRVFTEAGVPTYETPEDAVTAFQHLVRFHASQELLRETPPSIAGFRVEPDAAREVIRTALDAGRDWLDEPEARAVLSAYGVPVVATRTARDAQEAVACADELGYPVALKVLSPDVLHKSDVGGVVLDLADGDAVAEAAAAIARRVERLEPGARIEGFTVQEMARRPRAHELIVGASVDPVFGPFLLFGQGGTAVELLDDRAVALPPLNVHLAREMASRTRVWRLLQGYRDRPAADLDEVALVLVRLSQLLVDLPEVVELDVNPLLADESGVLALDARLRVERAERPGAERLAIRPYPRELEEDVVLEGGRLVRLRPIRPEDEPAHRELFRRLRPEDIRFRFGHLQREPPHSELARYTQIDYDREMAFIAADGGETLGVVRAVTDPDNARAELSIVVRSDLQGSGLGRALLDKMIAYARSRGTGALTGRVPAANERMAELARSAGFELQPSANGTTGELDARLPLG